MKKKHSNAETVLYEEHSNADYSYPSFSGTTCIVNMYVFFLFLCNFTSLMFC
jgi:hypothetical protein